MKQLFLAVLSVLVLAMAVSANPVITPALSSQAVTEGQTLSFQVITTPPDSGSTTFTKSLAIGTLTKINDTLANFSYTPGFTAQGSYSLTINASDSNSSDANTITLTVNDATSTLVLSAIKVGSKDQDRKGNISSTFTIQNTGSSTVSSIGLTSNAAAQFNVRFSGVPSSLTAGQSATVTVTADVPNNFDAVNASNVVSAFAIGTATATGTGANGAVTGQQTIEMQARNRLEIKRVRVSVNGAEESAKDGDTVDKIKPGDKLDFEVDFESKFSDKNDDPDINNVDVSLNVDDSDLSIDESEDAGDIGPDEDDTVKFDTQDVDDDAREGRHTMTVTAAGTDDNGARHAQKIEIKLEINRESHEVVVRRADISPSRITCTTGRRAADIRVTAVNIGRRDEKKAAIEVNQVDFGFSDRKTDIELDQDDSVSRSFTLNVPANAKAGSYNVEVRAMYDNSIETDSKTITLAVDSCEQPAANTSTSTPTVTVTPTTPTTTPATNTQTVTPKAKVSETGFTESNSYVYLLGGGIVVALALIIVIVAVAFKKQ